MFSYRHSFHAGNHADVLKHITLCSCLHYLTTSKDTPLRLIDVQAGAGLYRVDNDSPAQAEAAEGILPLWEGLHKQVSHSQVPHSKGVSESHLPAALAQYFNVLAGMNTGGALRKYPGSPLIAAAYLRAQDHLQLFELHPTDGRLLANHIAALPQASQIRLTRNNGFMGLKPLLPPPERRGLVLIDPSYELKTDYTQVADCVQDALRRFAAGCYLVWYPIIPRPQAHELPRRLKTLAKQADKKWLNVTFSIGKDKARAGSLRQGLRASGMFVINPPFVLAQQLQEALPIVQQYLPKGTGHGWKVEQGA